MDPANRLPKEVRDECRKDPMIPKRILIEIARKKQERSMVTQFKKYREQQAKAAAKEEGTAAPARPKRTKTEAIAAAIAMTASTIDALAFPNSTAKDRTILIGAMNALKEILEPAINRAVNNRGKPV